MNERARALWQRHAALLTAVLLHVGLLWLILPYMAGPPPPPADPVDVAMVPPPPSIKPPPKPKPIPKAAPPRPKPIIRPPTAVHPAETNASAGQPYLRPAPRLHVVQPTISLPLPPPLPDKPPMTLPVAAGTPAPGAPGIGAGGGSGNGTGTGNGGQAGNDYLIRLKAYIDAHKGGDRHREPNDADLVLVLDPNGVLTDIRVMTSSGDPAVDAEIVGQLRQMSPFPKPPAILFSASKPLLPVADKWIFPRP